MGTRDTEEQLEAARAEMVRLEAENAELIDRVKRAEAVIAAAKTRASQDNDVVMYRILATYQSGADQ